MPRVVGFPASDSKQFENSLCFLAIRVSSVVFDDVTYSINPDRSITA